MKGKCWCGKRATSEYLIKSKGSATTIKCCEECKPKTKDKNIILIDGK